MPESMMGSGDVNRANAEAGAMIFAQWLIVPHLERYKSALNHQLLPLFGTSGEGVEFDYDNPIPASPLDDRQKLNSQSLALQRFVSAGFDPEGAVASLGLPPMEWVGIPEGATTTTE